MPKWVFDVLFILVLMILAIYVYWWLRVETFVPSAGVRYMSAEETAAFLASDPDGYVKNMSPLDLYARKASSPEKYISRIVKSTQNFTNAQKIRFNKAALEADRKLRAMPHTLTRMTEIPWIFGMTEGETYEDGLPHTRANIIFVSSFLNEQHNELVRTLIHEKVHIYQRMYPEEMAQTLQQRGFKRWKQRMGEPRIRANPDVDPWIYINPKNDEPMMALYASDTPENLSDIFLSDPSFEHPFEFFAYEIANNVSAQQE